MFSLFNVPNKIPLTCITDDVLFPGSDMKIPITSLPNTNLVNKFLMSQPENAMTRTVIGVLPYKGNNMKSTENMIGTAALVLQIIGTNWPKHLFVLYVLGLRRIRVEEIISEEPYPVAQVTTLDEGLDLEENKEELSSLLEEFKKNATRLIDVLDLFHPLMGKMKKIADTMLDSSFVDVFASRVTSSYVEKLDMLNTPELTERLKKIIPLLKRHIEGMEVKKGSIIQKKGLPVIKLFRSRLPTDNLITDLEEGDDMAELNDKLKKANLPAYAHKVAFKEFQRLKRMGPFSSEHEVIRSYVELMSELPWSVSSKETIDICKAKKDLDADHYGMEKLKKRVLEYLAVRQLKSQLRGPILCFVGPPGVGKTSIGRSIARTLGREFHRISLGGVCNQSDIRGHRRTYVGALPGRIIQGLKTVGVNNPVMLLDEIDKMGASSHGDPGAALLEVLDPEQNCHFVDHYLNVPFDLSQVTFIATANRINTVPPALLDRMEVIHVSGYTQEEKFHIAQRHLIPKQLQQHGLDNDAMALPDETIKKIIRSYTREAGVRTLERKLAALCRSVAVRVAEAQKEETYRRIPIVIDEKDLEDCLGPTVYEGEDLWCRVGIPGIAVGLAWSTVGGDVMLVEASKMAGGSGELVLTGHLGAVMKESATLALNWVRTVAYKYGLLHDRNEDLMSETDVHIHFPAGAVGKDGPSAGVTIATALISLFTGVPIASDVALTGEITLRGVVLQVGGIKEKVLAAHRAGLARVILPKKCEKDLLEIPQNVLSEMTMVFVNHMSEVLDAAFSGELVPVKHCNTSITSKL